MNTIYKSTNKVNGKSYIGFDSSWPNRKKRHKVNASSGKEGKFYEAIRKYGWKSFEWEILYQSEDKEHTLNIMEPQYIKEYDTFNCGYNMTEGGEGCFGATSNKIWINNGHNHKRLEKGQLMPEGWTKGRLKIKRKVGMSDESKLRIGQKNKEHGVVAKLNQQILTCPHCSKKANVGLMKRWHFDNCKQKNLIRVVFLSADVVLRN
jgi:group I intron endonuclease